MRRVDLVWNGVCLCNRFVGRRGPLVSSMVRLWLRLLFRVGGREC